MTQQPEVWVVVASDDLGSYSTPERRGVPIVFETPLEGATREAALRRAAGFAGRYGECRIARLIFDDSAPPLRPAPRIPRVHGRIVDCESPILRAMLVVGSVAGVIGTLAGVAALSIRGVCS